MTARSATNLLSIQANSAVLFYRKMREGIVYHLEQQSHDYFGKEIKLDESCFGVHREGKHGRSTAGNAAVLRILKRDRKVYTQVNYKTSTLIPLITNKIGPESFVYINNYRSYNVLDMSDFHHQHNKLFGQRNNHINATKSLWN